MKTTTKQGSEKAEPTIDKPAYQLTKQEQATLDENFELRRSQIGPRVKVVKEGARATAEPIHSDVGVGDLLLAEALGSADLAFSQGLIAQLGYASSIDREGGPFWLNFALSVVKGVKPRDQMEAMHAAHMVPVHMEVIKAWRRLSGDLSDAQRESAQRALNEFARTSKWGRSRNTAAAASRTSQCNTFR